MTDSPPGLGAAAAGFLAAQILAAIFYGLATAASGNDESIVVFALAQLGLWLGLAGAPVIVSQMRGSGDLGRDFGLVMRIRDSVWMILGVLCQVVLLPALYLLIELVAGDLDVSGPARELTDRFDGASFAVLAVLVGVIAPIVEELFYRGLVLGAALRRWGERPAIVVSSLWFGLSHFQLVQLPALIGFGVVLAVLTVRTKRLGPAIAAHVGFNGITLVALAIW